MSERKEDYDFKQKKPDTSDGLDSMFALSYQKNGEESFPVLRAFQEFLEAERERARRKQLTLTLMFMGAIVVLVLVFCVVGAIVFNTLLKQSNQHQGKLVELLAQQRQTADTMEVSRVQNSQPPAVKSEQADADATLLELIDAVESLRKEVAAAAETARAADPPAEAQVAEMRQPTEEELLRQKGIYTPLKWRTDTPVETKPQPESQSENVVSKEEPPQTGNVAETVAVGPKNGKANAEAVEPDEPIENTAEIVAAGPQKQEEAANNTVEPEADPSEAGVRRISVNPSREMGVPAGYKPAAISVVTEDRRNVPWRIMMPTGVEGKGAAE